jgi:hypothetical protein
VLDRLDVAVADVAGAGDGAATEAIPRLITLQAAFASGSLNRFSQSFWTDF